MPYDTMPVDAIAALPVASVAEEDAHLFLWCFDRHVLSGAAVRVMRAWDFEPLNQTIIWDKGHYGLGHFPRPQHEVLLIGRRGKLSFLVRDVASVQRWRPVSNRGHASGRKHSAKPDASLDLVERASPGPYLELFARRRRFGWDAWGNEVESDVELAA
jgi:N6-adenosine-specific RNA methylase IME4